MRALTKVLFLLLAFIGAGIMIPCVAKNILSSTDYVEGSYFSIALPTKNENDELQKLAMSKGVDLNKLLHDMPEDEDGWGKIFGIAMAFSNFDRLALVYGYNLFAAFSYFCEGAGQAKCAELINAQQPKVKQRVRDFLFYHSFSPDLNVRKNNERLMREEMNLIFPSSYCFAKDDPLFESLRLR